MYCKSKIQTALLVIPELHRLFIWWWIVFVVWLSDKRRLALFTAATTVRDPNRCEFLTLREQVQPAQNLTSGFVEWSSAVVIHHIVIHHGTTAPPHYSIPQKLSFRKGVRNSCFWKFLQDILRVFRKLL